MTDAEQYAEDKFLKDCEWYEPIFQEQLKLDKIMRRRKRMINRIEGILIAVVVYMIIGLAR